MLLENALGLSSIIEGSGHAVPLYNGLDGSTGINATPGYYQIYFANGGDRTTKNVPEMSVCKELDVTMLWGVGGGKIQSSSWLIENKNKVETNEFGDDDWATPVD